MTYFPNQTCFKFVAETDSETGIQRQETHLGGNPRKHNKGMGSETEKRKKIKNTYLRVSCCGQWGPVPLETWGENMKHASEWHQ